MCFGQISCFWHSKKRQISVFFFPDYLGGFRKFFGKNAKKVKKVAKTDPPGRAKSAVFGVFLGGRFSRKHEIWTFLVEKPALIMQGQKNLGS